MAKLHNLVTFSKLYKMKTKRKIGLYAARYADLAVTIFCLAVVLTAGLYVILNPQKFI